MKDVAVSPHPSPLSCELYNMMLKENFFPMYYKFYNEVEKKLCNEEGSSLVKISFPAFFSWLIPLQKRKIDLDLVVLCKYAVCTKGPFSRVTQK